MVEGIHTRKVESTPNMDPTLGAFSQEQRQKGGAASAAVSKDVGASGIQTAQGGGSEAGQNGQGGRSGQGSKASFGDVLSLSPEAQSQLTKLQQRDREVRSHEQAHISAGGPHVQGGASYAYTKGPDNKQYATGGSVSIDTSPVPGDPDATKEKARMVRSAALAPGSPSAQDQSVAAQAASMEMQAQSEALQQEKNPDPSKQKPGEGHAQGKGEEGVNAALGNSKAQEANFAALRPGAAEERSAGNAASTEGSRATSNSSFLFTAMEFQARNSRVVAVYQAEQDKFIPPTDMAPWGTGIEIKV